MLWAEAWVSAFISVETAADMIICGWEEYWGDHWHIFDIIVALACIASLVIDFLRWVARLHFDDYFSVVLLIVRYMLQSVRVLQLLHNARKAKQELDVVDETPITIP